MDKTISYGAGNLYKESIYEGRLSDVPIGKKCRVKNLATSGLLRNRMLDIGIVPNTEIEVIRRNSTGDTKAFNIRGATIALRKEESSLIYVENIM